MKTDADSAELGPNGHGAGSTSSQSAAAAAALSGASQELHDFIADLEDLIQATTSLTGEDLARAKAKLYERIAAARQATGHMRRGVLGRTRTRIKVVNSYVHDKPWKSVSIGVAAGLVIGLLMSRRRA
jgi:ElaB/YqjD/DUF883 family membrane-anchored ribosome-binding protein